MQFTKRLLVLEQEAVTGQPGLRHFFQVFDGPEEDAVRTQNAANCGQSATRTANAAECSRHHCGSAPKMATGCSEKRALGTRGTRANRLTFTFRAAFRRSFGCFAELAMLTRFKVVAVVAVLAASVSSAALARYPCVPGYTYRHGVCQPVRSPGYSNPVSGAVSGEAAGAARGAATGGPVGAMVGGALGIAGGTVTGTANMLNGR